MRPEVRLEIGPLASWVPSDRHTIQPYAAQAYPGAFDDSACPVVAISAERTFWEKATILHQQAHRAGTMPPRYSRHYYDMYKLAHSAVKAAALRDQALLRDSRRVQTALLSIAIGALSSDPSIQALLPLGGFLGLIGALIEGDKYGYDLLHIGGIGAD